MPRSNIEFFRQAVEKDPDNTFARYSLAMEYRKANRLEEALEAFEALLARDPTYVVAYHMAGETAIALDEIEKAKDFLRRGIAAAQEANNQHAVEQMTELLESLG